MFIQPVPHGAGCVFAVRPPSPRLRRTTPGARGYDRVMRTTSWMVTLAGLLLAVSGCGKSDPAKAKGSESKGETQGQTPPADPLVADERAFGKYTVQVRWADGGKSAQRIEVRSAGTLLWSLAGRRFTIDSSVNAPAGAPVFGQCTDVTGDGQPDLIVREWSGGGSCCFAFHVVSLSEPAALIATLDARYDGQFDDLDGDQVPEFITRDWAFEGWRASPAASPAPRVVLKLTDGAYELAPELMSRPAPGAQERERQIVEVLTSNLWNGTSPPPSLWGTALDLMYAGNLEAGWDFIDLAWPEDLAGKDEFLREFRVQLLKSPYAEALGL